MPSNRSSRLSAKVCHRTHPLRDIRCLFTLLAGLLLAGGPAPAVWAQQSGQIEAVELGFDGIYKVGHWTPLWVSLTAGDRPLAGQLRITTFDGDGVEVHYQTPADDPVAVAAGATARLFVPVKFGRRRAPLTVEFLSEGQAVLRRIWRVSELPEARTAGQELTLALGTPIRSLDQPTGVRSEDDSEALIVFLDSPQAFPDHWVTYEAVSRIEITSSDCPVLEQLSDQQFAALDQWIRLGGRLLLSVGARGDEVFAADSEHGLARLQRFVPGDFVTVTALRKASALESFSGSMQPLRLDASGIPLTLLRDVRGRIELSDTGVQGLQPLVVTSAYGLGQVIFIAMDLDRPPLDTWEGRRRLVSRLLQGGKRRESAGDDQGGRVAHVGYTDLAGQLRSALDQFTGISLVPFYWIAGLLFLYILLIGPGDYFLLSRLVGRMPATWVTLPLLALGFSVVAVLLHRQVKVDEIRINQVDLLDVDVATTQVRGTTWADVYSPKTATYDLAWECQEPVNKIASEGWSSLFSWQGLPGSGLGGLNSDSKPAPFTDPYTLAVERRDSHFVGTPIQVASTKSFQGRWWGRSQPIEGVEFREDADGLLRGQVINPLPFKLESCVVLYSTWMYRLDSTSGELEPGEATSVDVEQPLNLEWRLTRRRVQESRDVSTPWSQNDLDVNRIMEVMMFHGAAGGDKYTQLTNRYQPYTDLSYQLDRGRAILMGRAAVPATELAIDGVSAETSYDRRWTFCRVIFPVSSWTSQKTNPLQAQASSSVSRE